LSPSPNPLFLLLPSLIHSENINGGLHMTRTFCSQLLLSGWTYTVHGGHRGLPKQDRAGLGSLESSVLS
jgi:hypothetical protein